MKEIKKEKLVPELRFKEFKEEWKETQMKNIASDAMYGLNRASKTYDDKNKYIRITDIDEENYSYNPQPLTSPSGSLSKEFRLQQNDIVFARTGASTGKSYLYKEEDGNLYFAGFLIKFHIDKADPKFIHLQVQRSKYKKWVNITSMRSGQPGINAEEYGHYKLNLPSLPEQQKISSFLSLIDKKIELLNKKKELLEIYKKGVMQKIFNRDIRFKDTNGNDYPEWEEKRLGEIFKERVERGNNDLELLSVTQDRGVVKRTEIDAIDNSNDNKDSYKKVCVGDIAYNSMRMWQGASGLSPYQGIVSPAYTVVYTNENPDFYSYMFKWPRVVYNFRRYSQGLTSDTWNLKYPLFSEIKAYTPQLKEQTKIATFLPQLDKLLFNIGRQINTASMFKRGLLQKMFV